MRSKNPGTQKPKVDAVGQVSNKSIELQKGRLAVDCALYRSECEKLKAELDKAQARVRELEKESDRLKKFHPKDDLETLREQFKHLKKYLSAKNWTVGDHANFFGFFLHGWRGRENQYYIKPPKEQL